MDLKSKKSAIIFNAFIMPGSGHILLGQKIKGYIIAVLIILAMLVPMVKFMFTVIRLLNEFLAGNSATPLAGVLGTAWVLDRRFILACLFVILLLWVYSVLDLLLVKTPTKPRS